MSVITLPTPEKAIEIEKISKSILQLLNGLTQKEIEFLFTLVQGEIKTHSVVVIK